MPLVLLRRNVAFIITLSLYVPALAPGQLLSSILSDATSAVGATATATQPGAVFSEIPNTEEPVIITTTSNTDRTAPSGPPDIALTPEPTRTDERTAVVELPTSIASTQDIYETAVAERPKSSSSPVTDSERGLSNELKNGMGIGIGIGVPLIAILGLGCFLWRLWARQNQELGQKGDFGKHDQRNNDMENLKSSNQQHSTRPMANNILESFSRQKSMSPGARATVQRSRSYSPLNWAYKCLSLYDAGIVSFTSEPAVDRVTWDEARSEGQGRYKREATAMISFNPKSQASGTRMIIARRQSDVMPQRLLRENCSGLNSLRPMHKVTLGQSGIYCSLLS